MTDPNQKSKATDAADRRARELGVDLATVKGTGSGGQITIEDVEKAHKQMSDHKDEAIAQAIKDAAGQIIVGVPKAIQDASKQLILDEKQENIRRQYVILDAVLAGPSARGVPETLPPFTAISGTRAFAPTLPPGESVVGWEKKYLDWKPL